MSRPGLAHCLPRLWYRRQLAPALLPLLPLSWLFRGLVALRRSLYRLGVFRSYRLPAPVVVVGNLTVGGSGKTPTVLWLVDRLRERGWRPGIISRGYGGQAGEGVMPVTGGSDASLVGDEPLLLARRSGVPVFIGRDRVAAGQALLAAHPECNVVVSDDGLQHYRLARAAEILVFDGRGTGNARMLPAGPLREPVRRASGATAIVWNIGTGTLPPNAFSLPQFAMRLSGLRFVAVNDGQRSCTADDLRGKRLHALAGIGDPSRFFRQLEAMGLVFEAHPFPDHHVFTSADMVGLTGTVLLMTEKDAVKCAPPVSCEAWFLPVDAHIEAAPDGCSLLDTILEKINGRTPA